MGRPVNEPFERAVLGHLLFTVLEKVDDVEHARIVANIAHSYEIIKRAATTTQKEAPWASDAKIQKLKFSNMWVRGFLRRDAAPPPQHVERQGAAARLGRRRAHEGDSGP